MKKLLLIIIVLFGLQTQTKAQINYCDSLSYSIVVDSTNWNTLTVTGNMNGLSLNMIDSIEWSFSACNALTCYIGVGTPTAFPSILPTDTVKLCYDAYIYYDSSIYVCTQCDSLVYDFMTDTWVLMNMGNPTAIQEVDLYSKKCLKMFDVLGRELTTAPIGTMYIRNNKKYIRVR
tara:strand:- start:16 stop:540 length:525 start_codon:yes stop_codon:yes gene_type:complete